MGALAITYPTATMGPIRDWLRTQDATLGASTRVYVGGVPRTIDPATDGKTIALQRVAGGGDQYSPLMLPIVQFDCWASTGPDAEALANALEGLLTSTAHGTVLESGVAAFAGARIDSVVWLPDPDSDTPRYVVTALVAIKPAS